MAALINTKCCQKSIGSLIRGRNCHIKKGGVGKYYVLSKLMVNLLIDPPVNKGSG